ncbi:MAG TPA: copper resistance CopC family protein [Steroidobacteraceae bacterium]|nr:copper resistance CopC family protein [Steroidobacteraceae bacterium]
MRLKHWAAGALLLGAAALAAAHAHLEEATPADHSVIRSAPSALVLRFSESARLTALWLTQDGGPKRKLEVPAASQPQITVALPPLTPGHYLISWRALSADGHVVPGQIRFTLAQ